MRHMLLFIIGVAAIPALALTVADGGHAHLLIALPDAPAADETEAAAELARYLGKLTHAPFAVLPEKDLQGRNAIFVGATRAAADRGISAQQLDRDAFVIKAQGGSLFIAGHDATATELGVHFFLQRYGGIRWYIPLEIGEHIPSRPTFTVPDHLSDTQQPAWKSRLWSAVSQMDPMWPKRNLCRSRYNFHHNLVHVLKPSEIYDQHPQWYPLINGQRIPKPPDGAETWQPCFANREMAAWVAQKITDYFDQNPAATSYSLGINDTGAGGYCQCPDCQALDDPAKPTFRGRPNYSNRVFTFMNRVAEITSQKHPDKLLGCLAYMNCEEVPSFPIHPNIIPYLTNDRAQWRDPAFKAQDQDLLRRWAKAARQLGIYDYYYGSGFIIPRFFPTISAESIKFCYRIGVRAWYAEIYSNWGLDGCKAWLASQLLWDPTQDARKLVEEYYANFFGAARDPMQKYWDRCEQLWMAQTGKGVWLKGFFDITQLEMFPPEVCAELRGYLRQAQHLADTDLTRRRVKLYADAFRYTDLNARVYWGNKALRSMEVHSAAHAEKLRQALTTYARADQQRTDYYTHVILKDPLLTPVIPFAGRSSEDLGGTIAQLLTRLADYYEATGGIPAHALRLSARLPATNPVAHMYAAYMAARTRPERAIETISNPGFEDQAGAPAPQGIDWSSEGCPPGWSSWVRPGTKAELKWVANPVRTGQRAVMLKGAEGAACFLTVVPARMGHTYVCTVYTRADVTAPQRVSLTIKWHDPQGKWFEQAPTHTAPLPQPKLKEWTPLTIIFTVPPGAGAAVVMLVGENMKPDDVAWFDDCSLKDLRLESSS